MTNITAFNLSYFSKYRTQLMGIAAVMIILCHANSYGVELPTIIRKLLIYGNLGVDIFLFLSGIGCYYSLAKNPALNEWYRRRFMRIFVPYAIMQFPFVVYQLCVGKFKLIEFLYTFSTIRFWTEHVGAWYVALLIPLYLITPFLFHLITRFKHRTVYTIAIIIGIILLCSVEPYSITKDSECIIHNIIFATKRCVSFCIGLYLGPLIAAGKKVNIITPTLTLAILYIMGHLFLKTMFMEWCLVIPICAMCIKFLALAKAQHLAFITWMGVVSLESYLANIYLIGTIKEITGQLTNQPFLQGGYIGYGTVIVGGIMLAYLVGKVSAITLKHT